MAERSKIADAKIVRATNADLWQRVEASDVVTDVQRAFAVDDEGVMIEDATFKEFEGALWVSTETPRRELIVILA